MVYTRAEQHEPAPTIHTMHTTHTIHSTQTLYITLFRANNNKCRNILRFLKGKGVGRTHTTPTLHTTRISLRHISHMLYIIHISRHISRTLTQVITSPNNI